MELAEDPAEQISPRRARAAAEERKAPRGLLPLLCASSALEGADNMLLPSVFYALQGDLGLSLSDLALVTLLQALCQSLVAPMWGILADRQILRRKTILVTGCLLQGCITMCLSSVSTLLPIIMLRMLNGAMLSSLRPTVNGVVSEVTAEKGRGKAFGCVQLSTNIGMVLGTLVGTNLSTRTIAGLSGWRIAFLCIGAVAVCIGMTLLTLMTEPVRPPRKAAADGKGNAVFAEVTRLLSYFKKPTFCLLVAQGCFGCVPWNALGYQTLFFQVSGLGNVSSSLLQAAAQCSQAIGGFSGGFVGDFLASRFKLHGRPLTAQLSVIAGIPIAWLIFMVPPPASGAFTYYLVLVMCLGLTATWCGAGVNNPILSEIVDSDCRGTIMAWESALEGSCAAIFGNAAVSLLAQRVFGYDLAGARGDGGPALDPENARALGKALMMTSFVPWMICLVFYSSLHWAYPRDVKRRAIEQERLEQQEQAEDEVQQVADKLQASATAKSPNRPRLSAAATAAMASASVGGSAV